MILNIFEEETEELNRAEVANDFFCQFDIKERRFWVQTVCLTLVNVYSL